MRLTALVRCNAAARSPAHKPRDVREKPLYRLARTKANPVPLTAPLYLRAASSTSSDVRSPVVGALTSTAMLPGLCSFFHILVWAAGISVQGNTSDMQGSMRRSSTNLLAAEACLRLAKCEPWMRFCRIQTKRASKVMLKPVVPAQNTTMPPRFTTKQETGKVCSPGCSKTVSTSFFSVMFQIALPNLRASAMQPLYSGELTFGSWPQQLKSLRLMTPLAPSDITNSRFVSSEMTPIAFAPAAAQSWIPNTPSPPEAPQTSTLSLGFSRCRSWPKSMR